MIYHNLLILIIVWNLHSNKKFNLILFGTRKYDCILKTKEILNFLHVMNSFVTIGSRFFIIQQSYHEIQSILCVSLGL